MCILSKNLSLSEIGVSLKIFANFLAKAHALSSAELNSTSPFTSVGISLDVFFFETC